MLVNNFNNGHSTEQEEQDFGNLTQMLDYLMMNNKIQISVMRNLKSRSGSRSKNSAFFNKMIPRSTYAGGENVLCSQNKGYPG